LTVKNNKRELYNLVNDVPRITEPDSNNGLQKKSAVDCFQIRAISHKRFVEKIGSISKDKTDLIKKSIALILDIEPERCE
jgi:mRNA interferase MazF